MPKVRRPAKAVSLSEAGEVRVLTDWLDARGIGYFHVPNNQRGNHGGDRRTKGAPDLVLTRCTSGPMPYPRPVAVEMKRASGGVIGIDQEELHGKMRSGGWFVLVSPGADDAIRRLIALGF